jgi:hypothetical protein
MNADIVVSLSLLLIQSEIRNWYNVLVTCQHSTVHTHDTIETEWKWRKSNEKREGVLSGLVMSFHFLKEKHLCALCFLKFLLWKIKKVQWKITRERESLFAFDLNDKILGDSRINAFNIKFHIWYINEHYSTLEPQHFLNVFIRLALGIVTSLTKVWCGRLSSLCLYLKILNNVRYFFIGLKYRFTILIFTKTYLTERKRARLKIFFPLHVTGYEWLHKTWRSILKWELTQNIKSAYFSIGIVLK